MKKLLFITSCALLTACCPKEYGVYEQSMSACMSSAMEYSMSEDVAAELCHCVTLKLLDTPVSIVATDEVADNVAQECIQKYKDKK